MSNLAGFLHYCDPATFASDRLDFHPDPTQTRILRFPKPRLILNCARQWGKSTTTAALVTHHLAYGRPNSLTLVLSPSARQSAELLRKIADFSRLLGIRPRGHGDNELLLLLPNGSRAIALPGNDRTIRCFSAVSLIIIDEAARVPDPVYKAVRPMLATSNGRLILLSTPLGKRGFFHHEWADGGPDWSRITIPATECPRIPQAFLDEERRSQGDWHFRQEYLCEFVDHYEQVFPYDLLQSALSEDVIPLTFP